MATSGSSDFSLDARAICNEALFQVHVIGAGDTADADDAAVAERQLNLMLKTWGASSDPKLWLLTEGTQALTQGQASYTLSAARKVLSVRRRTSSIDTPLNEMSREDYFDYPSKSAQGIPTDYYFDPQRATRTLYVVNAPDAYSAANTTLQYTYLRVIEDIDDLANDLDAPQEWFEAIIASLAARLAPLYRLHVTDPQGAAALIQRAADLYGQLSSYDEEAASIFLQPA